MNGTSKGGFGARVVEQRQKRRMSQRDLAEAAKMSVGHLSDLENEKTTPRLTTIQRIAAALDVVPATLLR